MNTCQYLVALVKQDYPEAIVPSEEPGITKIDYSKIPQWVADLLRRVCA